MGVVTAYVPPTRIVFTWKAPEWDAATEVEVRFSPEDDGTRVDLEHRGWERGRGAGTGPAEQLRRRLEPGARVLRYTRRAGMSRNFDLQTAEYGHRRSR